MCNPRFGDELRKATAELIAHVDELRLKFNEVEQRQQLGNLGEEAVGALNRAVHLLEKDAASFEQILESYQ